MPKKLLLIIASLAALVSCQHGQTDKADAFFDLSIFAEKVTAQMKELNPKVEKHNFIDNIDEEISLDRVNWDRELELLKQADINKAAFVKSYSTEKTGNELTYTLYPDEDLRVKKLHIVKDANGEVSRVHALMGSENYLYRSAKSIEFRFENKAVKSYHIKGWQKLFVGKKRHFEIVAEVE